MSDIPEMVERVARAIALAQLRRQYVDLEYLAGRKTAAPNLLGAAIEIDRIWHTFVPEARAAIAAMREPTPAMIAAPAYTVVDGIGRLSDGDTANDVWRAMIDAALGEPASVKVGTTELVANFTANNATLRKLTR